MCLHAGGHSIPPHSLAQGGSCCSCCGGCKLLSNQGYSSASGQDPLHLWAALASLPPGVLTMLGLAFSSARSERFGSPSTSALPHLPPAFPRLMKVSFHNRCSEVRKRVTVGAHSTTSPGEAPVIILVSAQAQ